MKNLETFKRIADLLRDTSHEMLKLSLDNVHAKGLFSLVLGGSEPGTLFRVFMAQEPILPFQVQLHSHRYPITLTALKGVIKQHVAFETAPGDGVTMGMYIYHSFMAGGSGTQFDREVNVALKEFFLPPGSSIQMTSNDLHTVSCEKDAIWIVEEHGYETEFSKVLGIPFLPNNLYSEVTESKVWIMGNILLQEVLQVIEAFETYSEKIS